MNEFLLTQNILREHLIKNGCKMNNGFGPISKFMKWLRRKTKKGTDNCRFPSFECFRKQVKPLASSS